MRLLKQQGDKEGDGAKHLTDRSGQSPAGPAVACIFPRIPKLIIPSITVPGVAVLASSLTGKHSLLTCGREEKPKVAREGGG